MKSWATITIAIALTPPATAQEVRGFQPSPEAVAAYAMMPDSEGSGPFPALKEVDPSLPHHVVYRPRDLTKLGQTKLGIVIWGNGGCAADGASARLHLAEIASHGYLVIAPGGIHNGPGTTPEPDRHLPPGFVPTNQEDLRQALDWALAQGIDQKSQYHGRIDPHAVAVSGYSCGGLQAIAIASDPRVRAVVIHNSGIFPDGAVRIGNLRVTHAALAAVHSPILYVLGGAADVAYHFGMADAAAIRGFPVSVVNIAVGHAGTFADPNGGLAAAIAAEWLNWRLRGSIRADSLLRSANCRHCSIGALDIRNMSIDHP